MEEEEGAGLEGEGLVEVEWSSLETGPDVRGLKL